MAELQSKNCNRGTALERLAEIITAKHVHKLVPGYRHLFYLIKIILSINSTLVISK